MLWAILALIGAVTNASYYIATKKMLRSTDPYILATGSFLATAIFLLALSVRSGIPQIGEQFLSAVTVTAIINIIATVLSYRALATTDISLAVPMISFTPVFLIATSFLFLHELPTFGGAFGILIIVAGSYVLNLSQGQKSLLDPFRSLVQRPGVLFMLVVSFLYAISVNFDKMVVLESDIVFGSGFVFLVIGITFAGISVFSRWNARRKDLIKKGVPDISKKVSTPPPCRWCWAVAAFIVIGFLITIEAIVINEAYTMQIVPYVIAFKRMSIIFTVISGAIVFHETEIGRRLAGAMLMVAGAVIILLTL